MTFLVEMAHPGLGNLCQVLHSGITVPFLQCFLLLSINILLGKWEIPLEASGCSGELQRCYPTPQTIIFMDY